MKESLLLSKEKNEKERKDCYRNSRRSFGKVIFEHYTKDPTFTFVNMQGEYNGLLGAVS